MQEKSIKKSIFFERIEQIIDYYDIKNVNDFAVNYLGYKSSQKINRLKEENTSPSFEILNDISTKFEKINPGWLLTGKGNMLIQESIASEPPAIYHAKSIEKKHNQQNIPLYDINAAAGLKTLFAGGKQNIVDTLKIPNLSKVDGAMFITGDSMYPLLKSGDIVVFKQIHNIDFLHLGDIYILAYEIDGDEYVVVKYINHSEKEGCVKLVSYNEHYTPIDIPINSINTIALVKASVRYNTMQ